MKKITLTIIALLALSACQPVITPTVTNFDDCVAAGNPIMESYPRQCSHEGETFTEEIELPDLSDDCLSFENSKWLPETNECEGISKDACDDLGGTYNECASACRNDPNAEICTMQCVIVCQLKPR